MHSRCYCEKQKSYSSYGGQGVTVCRDWHNYHEFKRWALANGWEEGLVISRNGDTGNYEPTNCSWKTRVENCIEALDDSHKERRVLTNAQVVEIRKIKGKSQNQIAIDYGVSRGTIRQVILRLSYKDVT